MKYLLTFIFFFISSCGFAPLDNSKTEVTKVFIIYQDNLLNNQFVNEIKRKRGFLNLQLTDSESAEIKIEIAENDSKDEMEFKYYANLEQNSLVDNLFEAID